MTRLFIVLLTLTLSQPVLFASTELYNQVYNDKGVYPELIMDNASAFFTENGLLVNQTDRIVRLNKYYSLGNRTIRYHVKFSQDAIVVFRSDTKDFIFCIDVPEKKISIETTTPITWKRAAFIDYNHEYIVEISRVYQKNIVKITDLYTNQSSMMVLTTNGTGGCGTGALNNGFYSGNQYDYYCFALQKGTSVLIKQISVIAGVKNIRLLIYGDSITDPAGYFPTEEYPYAWTQLVMDQVKGEAICSGRGGCQIKEVMERIKNELPYLKAKYVMVTIGTNGGNTEENLSELVEYILSQGSIPILNNIPSNESGSQVECNRTIEKVRQKYQIKGCKFDLATSLNNDGIEVDKSMMYYEDYTGSYGWHIYHHPNVKGSLQMFTRTLIDIPEIYE
jgi:hypothetical protein